MLRLICAMLVPAAVACGDPATSSEPISTSALVSELPTTALPPPDTVPVTTAQTPVSTTELEPPTDPVTTTVAPATEHQLAVLAEAFSLPGRPELHDVPGGQVVTVGSRGLYVNVPIQGSWQYVDVDVQDLPAASTETTEDAARSLLARLGIDATDQTATFTPNGPAIDIELAGCMMRFSSDGQIAWAIGAIADID